MAAWLALSELGYRVTGIYLDMGYGKFSQESEEKAQTFAADNHLPLKVYRFKELFGLSFGEAAKNSKKPVCGLCGTLKRYYLNQLSLKEECDVQVTGHNLDDETAFLLGNVLHWQLDYLSNQSPVIPSEPGMIRKAKPLIRLTDEETKLYTDENNIEVAEETCPNATGATSHTYKEMMNYMERTLKGSKAAFHTGFLKRALPVFQQNKPKQHSANYCQKCGYKTSNKEYCFVCSLHDECMQNQ
jgi:uncharacterized protein (TIGR00269 family)